MSASLTLIMAAWNAEKYIERSVKSVLNQTYRDLELIVVNDGSTDGTEALLSRRVRRMMIQPMVENALLHGFMHSSFSDGSIGVSAWADGEILEIMIENDGEGIAVETIVALNDAPAQDGAGVGFANLRERIRLLYPQQGMIEISSDGIRGAAVRIRL